MTDLRVDVWREAQWPRVGRDDPTSQAVVGSTIVFWPANETVLGPAIIRTILEEST